MADEIHPTDAMHKIGAACCDPLWIQHRTLAGGHDKTIDNATATFIKFRDHNFICTCAHVVEAAKGDLVPALMVGQLVLNVASYHVDNVYRHNFRFPDRTEFDIAIAPLDASYWNLLQTKKAKTAIDLDAWEEPEWLTTDTFVAVGYFNEHKYNHEGKVATPLGLVAAEAASSMGAELPKFALSSRLNTPHGYYFSGMSGGPIFLPVSADKMLPVGIVFEGGPSSGRHKARSTLIDPTDILIRAYTLTPLIFEDWLSRTGLLPPTQHAPT
ncbi:MAG: hypothetical protein E7774_01600 [Bradyrhizobium sp.]|nr:MAG: hypothetical protein E7774_01600 [Bradyrhizobium sp.]